MTDASLLVPRLPGTFARVLNLFNQLLWIAYANKNALLLSSTAETVEVAVLVPWWFLWVRGGRRTATTVRCSLGSRASQRPAQMGHPSALVGAQRARGVPITDETNPNNLEFVTIVHVILISISA